MTGKKMRAWNIPNKATRKKIYKQKKVLMYCWNASFFRLCTLKKVVNT